MCVDQSWETVQNTSQVCSQLECHNEIVGMQKCPTLGPISTLVLPTATIESNSNTVTYSAGIAVLVLILLATAAGWILTCVVVWRKSHYKLR